MLVSMLKVIPASEEGFFEEMMASWHGTGFTATSFFSAMQTDKLNRTARLTYRENRPKRDDFVGADFNEYHHFNRKSLKSFAYML